MHAGGLAGPLVALDDVAARDRDQVLPAAAGEAADAGTPGHLRIFDPERRRLPHLPADQLIEILRSSAGTFSNRISDTLATESGSTSATRAAAAPTF